ncbi:MAG: ATP-binding protein, partial [Dehalococcoidia bacterium]
EFRHIYVNDAACELLAASREEILGGTAVDLFADGPAQRAELATARAELRTCGVTHHIVRFSRADGSVVLLDAHTVALPGGTYHSIVRDVTVLKETEEALRRSEAALAAAQRMAKIGSWEWDLVTRTITWSAGMYAIYGLTADQFTPTYENVPRLISPDDPSGSVQRWSQQAPGDGPCEWEYDVVRGDGAARRFHTIGEVVFDVQGRPLRAHGTVQDVTEQREAEEERRKLEAQVALAQRMESLGRLAGGMAHDFNNLLAVVLASLDMAALDASAASREAIDQAREAARSAAELCRQLLLIGRSTVGVPEPQSVTMLVRNAERLLARTLAAGITVRHDIPNGLSVLGNGPQLEGALFNLALNARDAMPDGGTLHLRARPVHGLPDAVALEPRDDGYVLIEVEDTGFGMDEETVARMFDPFFTTKAEGTGLGAAAVYGIVRDHGGSVTVDSAVGRGTTVRVFLPAAPADSQPPENDPDETGLVETGTVLVVDDMEPLRRTVQGILERAGFTTMAAANGDGALALLRQEGDSVNAVVLDCMLPDLTGRAVFDTLRGQGQAVPVLFISGYASDTLDGLEPDGGWAFLQKPFDADSLLAALTALMGRAATAPLRGDA